MYIYIHKHGESPHVISFIHICIYIYMYVFMYIYTYIYMNMRNRLKLYRLHIFVVTHCICWFTHICTQWRRPIRCLISWIAFLKLATNYRALLRKMTYKDKASSESSPPCSDSLHLLVHTYLYRVAKIHRMPYLVDHFPQISHQLQGSFAENDL